MRKRTEMGIENRGKFEWFHVMTLAENGLAEK